MTTEFRRLPVHGSGDQDGSDPSTTGEVTSNSAHGVIPGINESHDRIDHRTSSGLTALNHPFLISGLTGLAILSLLSVFFTLPPPDVLGRVLCVVGVALSYFIGARWMAVSKTTASNPDHDADPPAVQTIDQRMEQLEDAKWQLNDSAARYRDLLDQHQDMIIRTNVAGQLVFANKAFCKKLDIDHERAQGQTLSDLLTQKIALPVVVPGKMDSDLKRQQIQFAGGQRWIEWHGRSISANDKQEIQYTGRDITRSVLAQQELKEARDQAQSANRSKSRFLASMSHEIRTPMNGILGMVSLLNSEELSEQQKTYLDAIDLSARNLLAIIDEILDFSKIEAGKIQLAERYFSIEDTVLAVVELLAPAAQEKGLEMAWTVSRDARGEFLGDPVRVRQVLLNLISNAVKFTDHGGIRVAVTGRELVSGNQQESVTQLEIRVSDTGVGLTEDEQRTLFSEFGQTDQALKRQAGGTGLGLAISRRLVQAMGGDISVENNVGAGSTFVARLELKPIIGVSAARSYISSPRSLNLKVLLAFDRRLERAALAEMLTDCGISVVECAFEEAQSVVAQAHTNNDPFTRVVVDADADPSTAAAIFKSAVTSALDCGVNKDGVRGYVLVGISSRDALVKFKKSGFDAYLVRPVRRRTLFEQLISERATPSREGRPVSDGSSSDNLAPKLTESLRFLLVEDNDINALLVERQLQHAGHTVDRVTNGVEALETVEKMIVRDQEHFDFILMDVLLPKMDGLEATTEIKGLYERNGIAEKRPPVVALTANAFEEDRERCLAAGMDDYLAKPFDQDMLNVVLSRCLASR